MFWLPPALACEAFAPMTDLASIEHPKLTESSGLAPSRRTPGALWTHDDSGDASLFRFSLDGTVTEHDVPDADNKDWEDIASAPCPGSGDCLYIGDIGSDRGDPRTITVYVVKEPRADGDAKLVQRWELRWPGAVRDAETLLVHPCTLDAWILTKGEPTEVFRIPKERGRDPVDLVPVTTIAVDQRLTGGDIAPDGSAVVFRSDDDAWILPMDADDPDAHWNDTPDRIVEGLVPGEGLGWDLDGDLLFTAEGFPTAVSRMACAAGTPEVCKGPGCGCQTPPAWSLLLDLKRR